MNQRISSPETGSDPGVVFPRVPPATTAAVDLTSWRLVRTMVHWRGFPPVLQATLLVVFIALAIAGWGDLAPAGVNGKLFAKSNLVTLVIWGLWWPAMVWAAVFLGRAWCMVCPLELVSNASERAGRALGLTSRPLPRWIAGGAVIVGLYVTLQLLVAGVQLHRTPAYTAIFMIALLGLAAASALWFEHRAFCRGFCPVGLLLGTYGRGGMLAVRPAPDSTGGPDARTCPTLLNPARLDTNKDCLVCCRCVKAGPAGSMQLVWRPPFSARDSRQKLASWPVTLFVLVASGYVTAELCSEWAAAQALFLRAPKWLAGVLHAPGALHWLEPVWMLAVFPLALWLVMAVGLRVGGPQEKIGQIWRRLALPMAVVVAAGHLTKGLAKFVSWVPFLPQAVRDPNGTDTAIAITKKTLAAPAPLVSLSTVGIIGVLLIVIAAVLAVREHRIARRDEAHSITTAVPYGVLAALYLSIVAGWIVP